MKAQHASVLSDDAGVLASLQQISGERRLGQQREPKWFHPFPARMPLAIATHFIRSLTTADAVVLDPMVGSGSTLVAARRLNRTAIGVDRDHLAVRIARCASQTFSSDSLDRLRATVLERGQKLFDCCTFRLPDVRGELPEEDQEFVKYWFPVRSQRQLFAVAAAIDELKGGAMRDFAWVVFSSLIIAKSAGASYALDISRSRPHKRNDKPIIAPFDAWAERFRSSVARLPFLDEPSAARVDVCHGDARELSVADASVDFVLTSPPYRNAIDYLLCHKFSLVWMGHRLAELRELRGTMIGTERGLWSLDGLPAELEHRLERADAEAQQVALVRRYLSDMRKLLAELRRVLRPGGLCLLVVGPTMVNLRKSDAADVFDELGKAEGLVPSTRISGDWLGCVCFPF